MKKLKPCIIFAFIIASAGSAVAIPPPVVNVPDGTPEQIEGFDGQSLYVTYRLEVSTEIENGAKDALQNIRRKDFGSEPNLRPHGAVFRYKPVSQSEVGQIGKGRILYSCRFEDGCDWIMEVVTVPDVDIEKWAHEHFDAATAASNLKAQNITSNIPASYSGYWLGLPSPKNYISNNAKPQLYFGEECPQFVEVLAADSYGRKRAKKLLSLSKPKGKLSKSEHVKDAAFEISITETADERRRNFSKPSLIELKFTGESGNAIGNTLFESIKGCPNRARN